MVKSKGPHHQPEANKWLCKMGPSNSNATTTDSKAKREKPARPLSAYNIFFQLQRKRIVEGKENMPITEEDLATHIRTHVKVKRPHRKTHGKISFQELARQISTKWKELSEDEKDILEDVARRDRRRYQKELEAWKDGKWEDGETDEKDKDMVEEDKSPPHPQAVATITREGTIHSLPLPATIANLSPRPLPEAPFWPCPYRQAAQIQATPAQTEEYLLNQQLLEQNRRLLELELTHQAHQMALSQLLLMRNYRENPLPTMGNGNDRNTWPYYENTQVFRGDTGALPLYRGQEHGPKEKLYSPLESQRPPSRKYVYLSKNASKGNNQPPSRPETPPQAPAPFASPSCFPGLSATNDPPNHLLLLPTPPETPQRAKVVGLHGTKGFSPGMLSPGDDALDGHGTLRDTFDH